VSKHSTSTYFVPDLFPFTGTGVYEQLYEGFEEDGVGTKACSAPSIRPSLLSHPYRLREAQAGDFYSQVNLPFPAAEAEKVIRFVLGVNARQCEGDMSTISFAFPVGVPNR